MRTNKSAIIWSIIVSFTALICSLVLHYFSFEYWSNLFSGIFASGVLTFMISVINPNLNLIKFVTWDKLRYGVYRVACFPFAPRTLIQLSLFVGHTKPRTRSYS